MSLKQSTSAVNATSGQLSETETSTRGVTSDGSGRVSNTNTVTNTVSDRRVSSMQLEVHRVLHDAARRKLNVVVTGLPETAGSTSDTVKEDSEAFTKFCEENLDVKPSLARKGCTRLGKRVGDQPRKLLVHLNSESSAASLLSASRNMQRCESTKTFYINPDLSRAEAQLAFEERKRRRAGRKAVRRTDDSGSATGADIDYVMVTFTGPSARSTDDAAVLSSLSPTSVEFHPSSSLNCGANSGPSSSSVVNNNLDSSRKTFFRS